MSSFPRMIINCIFVILLLHLSSSVAMFAWSDCGVQLSQVIHYQSTTISPSAANAGGSLSINVQATIVSPVYYADTHVTIYKDNELFLDVDIQDLCSIIQTSESLSCPLAPGKTSFTYSFPSVPQLPSGKYNITIRSLQNSQELGCLRLSGEVNGLSNSCYYTSNFNTTLLGIIRHQTDTPLARQKGDWLRVGPVEASDYPYGTFSTELLSSPDIAGTFPLTNYVWGINGSLVNIVKSNQSQAELQYYTGTFTVGNLTNGVFTTILSGQFNWILDVQLGRTPEQVFSGTLTLTPRYVFNSQFSYPVLLGNLGPFQFTMRSDYGFIVTGSKRWCTCPVDSCGVCGGGNACNSNQLNPSGSSGLTSRVKAAIIIGVIGGLLGIILIILLSRMVVKAKRARPHDDSDLIDHPQKPDYGTMAIDDSIREGERGL